MITKATILEGHSTNPHLNLAVEKKLFDNASPGEIILYLWQNANTVVIGRNQNAYTECNLDNMEKDGVRLARRTTGGGAVFHDLGNMNFSFIMPVEMKTEGIPEKLIKKSCERFGIEAEITGRNDIYTNGRKFSGNAFCQTKKTYLHHGTILVNADTQIMKNYLNVSKEKLASKGVKSVAARVINLIEVCPDLTIAAFWNAMRESFLEMYQGRVSFKEFDAIEKDPDTEALKNLYASKEWLLDPLPAPETAESIITEWSR